MVSSASSEPFRPYLEKHVESVLKRLWPRWAPVVSERPAGTVPCIKIGLHEEARAVMFVHTSQTPRHEVPDHPETKGFARSELLAAVDKAEAAGLVGVLVLFEVRMSNRPDPIQIASVIGLDKGN